MGDGRVAEREREEKQFGETSRVGFSRRGLRGLENKGRLLPKPLGVGSIPLKSHL